MPYLFLICLLALFCAKKEGATGGAEATETISPAVAQPSPTGTDAMTQTVDIEDSRSVAEGGTATAGDTTTTTGTATPATETAEKKTQSTKSRPPGRTQ